MSSAYNKIRLVDVRYPLYATINWFQTFVPLLYKYTMREIRKKVFN